MDRQWEGRKPAGGQSDSYISFYAFFHMCTSYCVRTLRFSYGLDLDII
jgi:hypothetical protein